MKINKFTIFSAVILISSFFVISINADKKMKDNISIEEAIENAQKKDWISLGKITAFNKDGYINGTLLISRKPIQGYNMFKVVRFGEEYPVIQNTKYVADLPQERQTNGKIVIDNEFYYLNVPIDVEGFKAKASE